MGGTADVVFRDGTAELVCDPSTPAGFESVCVPNLVATWLVMKGSVSLHATAVSRGAEGLVIAGPSGCGKSTIAHLLCERGFNLVSEDVVELRQGQTRPGFGELRLRNPVEGAEQSPDSRWLVKPEMAGGTVRIANVIVPRLGVGGGPERLGGLAAATTLLSFERVGWWNDPQIAHRWMAAVSGVVRDSCVTRWSFSDGITPGLVDQMIEGL